MNIEVGKTYAIFHSRKGRFSGRVVSFDDEWATVLISREVAKAMMRDNVRCEGEELTVRLSQCTFTEEAEARGNGE